MHAAIDPTHDTGGVDCGRARIARGIFDARRVPILAKARGFVFVATRDECEIGLQFRKIEIGEAHRVVRRHRFIADASRGWIVARAKFLGFALRPDRHEADRDTGACELLGGLAQLREGFGEEASTDVTQPDHECGFGDVECEHERGCGDAGVDGIVHLADVRSSSNVVLLRWRSIMMPMDLPDRRLTPEEYRALEAISPERLEYRDGYAVALAAPTKNHSRITGTLAVTIGLKAREHGCEFFGENAKVLTPAGDRLIPDFLVTCDERDREDVGDARGEAIVRHPWLVVEVLSQSTASDDMTEKFDAYRSIVELTHYVVIDSRRRSVHLYERLPNGEFSVSGRLDRLMLPSLGEHGVTIDEIYRDTTVPNLRDLRTFGDDRSDR